MHPDELDRNTMAELAHQHLDPTSARIWLLHEYGVPDPDNLSHWKLKPHATLYQLAIYARMRKQNCRTTLDHARIVMACAIAHYRATTLTLHARPEPETELHCAVTIRQQHTTQTRANPVEQAVLNPLPPDHQATAHHSPDRPAAAVDTPCPLDIGPP